MSMSPQHAYAEILTSHVMVLSPATKYNFLLHAELFFTEPKVMLVMAFAKTGENKATFLEAKQKPSLLYPEVDDP